MPSAGVLQSRDELRMLVATCLSALAEGEVATYAQLESLTGFPRSELDKNRILRTCVERLRRKRVHIERTRLGLRRLSHEAVASKLAIGNLRRMSRQAYSTITRFRHIDLSQLAPGPRAEVLAHLQYTETLLITMAGRAVL